MKFLVLSMILASPSAFALECTAEQYLYEGTLLSFDPGAAIDSPQTPNRLASFGTTEIPAEGFGDSICVACGWGAKATDFRLTDRGLWPVLAMDRSGNFTGLDTSGKSYKVVSEIACRR